MDFLILAIISLITLINPVGIIPTYLSIIENFSKEEQKDMKKKYPLLISKFLAAALIECNQFPGSVC